MDKYKLVKGICTFCHWKTIFAMSHEDFAIEYLFETGNVCPIIKYQNKLIFDKSSI